MILRFIIYSILTILLGCAQPILAQPIIVCKDCKTSSLKQAIALAKDYQNNGVGFVAISSNDVVNYPDDDPALMKETAKKYGDEQVLVWRRSFDTPPPALTADDPRCERSDRRYAKQSPNEIPLTECLKDTVARVLPFWNESMAPAIKAGKRIVVAAHGNSIRALVKYLDNISDDEIVDRLISALVGEGRKILDEGIAQRSSDIDIVYIYGYGFPASRGGPMFYAEQQQKE